MQNNNLVLSIWGEQLPIVKFSLLLSSIACCYVCAQYTFLLSLVIVNSTQETQYGKYHA